MEDNQANPSCPYHKLPDIKRNEREAHPYRGSRSRDFSPRYPVVCGTDMMDSLDYLPLRATYRRDEIIREYFHHG